TPVGGRAPRPVPWSAVLRRKQAQDGSIDVRQRSVVAAVAVLVVVAAAVTLLVVQTGGPGPGGDDGSDRTGSPPSAAAVVDQRLPTADDLVGAGTVRALDGRRGWRIGRTDDNTTGSGTTSACQ